MRAHRILNTHCANEHGDIYEVQDMATGRTLALTRRCRVWGIGPGAPRGGVRWITSTDGTIENTAKTRKESVAKFLRALPTKEGS